MHFVANQERLQGSAAVEEIALTVRDPMHFVANQGNAFRGRLQVASVLRALRLTILFTVLATALAWRRMRQCRAGRGNRDWTITLSFPAKSHVVPGTTVTWVNK